MDGDRSQGRELVFALDIGTRSVIGVAGQIVDGRLKVLAIEKEEHGKRAMLDGQIDDIGQVGALARAVTRKLEEKLDVRLERVCVAAAGRALRTERASFTLDLPQAQGIGDGEIERLESGAVAAAEAVLQQEDGDAQRQFFLVGYTVAQYRVDHYPMAVLRGHSGKLLEAEVVATFLPGEVVESLYAAMRAAELQVVSMTLEPIAAMNAAIPAELRLLNLALVDIGAGTADVALCREGSVVGYTMVTLAGDEITEAIMRAFLVDFQTAERMKQELDGREEVRFRDILGLEQTVKTGEVSDAIGDARRRLAEEVAGKIREINGGPPSALFLAGGGSKLSGLREQVAQCLDMDLRRVAVAGNNFEKSAFSEEYDLDDPELATPLGIAVSAGLGLINDSYSVTLNERPVKLFRSGLLTAREVLFMNGCAASDLIAGGGQNLSVTVDGRRVAFRGEPGAPAVLRVNGEEASYHTVIHAGDRLDFVPARRGEQAVKSLGELLGADFEGEALVNNEPAGPDRPLRTGDVILTVKKTSRCAVREESPPGAPPPGPVYVTLNGAPMELPPKPDGTPYYLMDLLQYSGIDFQRLDRPVALLVNGVSGMFRQVLREGDSVTIRPEEPDEAGGRLSL